MTDLPSPFNSRQQRWLTIFLVLGSLFFAFQSISFAANLWNYFADVILTFFLAWLLAFILSSPVRWLVRAIPRLPRVAAIVLVYGILILILVAIVILIAQAIASSLSDFISQVPTLQANLPNILRDWSGRLQAIGFGQVDLVARANEILAGLQSTAQGLLGPLQQAALASVGVLGSMLIIFFLSVFIIIDSENILNFLLRLVPPRYAEEARLLERSISRSFGGFLRGQATIGILYALVAFVVSAVFRLDYLPLTTATSGILMAIPFFGPFVSWLPPVLVAIVTSTNSTVPVLIVMIAGWFVIMNIVQPRLMAGAVGIPPIVVMGSVLIGSKVAGVAGAIFGLPIAAVISSLVMFMLRRNRFEQGTVAERAARRLGAREGRSVRIPREPDPLADESPAE